MLFVMLAHNQSAPQIVVSNHWQVQVMPGTVKTGRRSVRISAEVTLEVSPPKLVEVRDELYDNIPLFDEKNAPWDKGVKLKGLDTSETTAPDMLVAGSFKLKSGTGDAPALKRGVDYELEPRWATFGRLPGGSIQPDQKVWADYEFGQSRIDSIVADSKGEVTLLQGEPEIATPVPPKPGPGETIIANIWIPGLLPALTSINIYPILERHYPAPKRSGPPIAATLLPKTWAKLKSGQQLNILAWGDSVTAGGQASDKSHQYQYRFESLLQKRFPDAHINLTTLAWGGRTSDSFLNEPPGSPYNFNEKVIQPHPDLIVMEFVNDAYMTPAVVEEKYSYLLKRFQEIGAEWIILTPHYVRPDWMGAPNVRIEKDPRPYVEGLREFAAKHKVALADASLRWGHLVKEGIPYITLLSNCINHPNDRGHEMFAQSLMELFGGD